MTQSFNIPDSISPEALQEHLENAAVDEPINDLPEDLFDQAEHWVQQASSNSDNPMIVHKLMIVAIVDRMIQFHERVAERMNEEDGETGEAWLKDAGKFQAIMNILQTIECGPDDPMCTACGGHH
jgi:hypothetical protein